jgi:hypothetical protein
MVSERERVVAFDVYGQQSSRQAPDRGNRIASLWVRDPLDDLPSVDGFSGRAAVAWRMHVTNPFGIVSARRATQRVSVFKISQSPIIFFVTSSTHIASYASREAIPRWSVAPDLLGADARPGLLVHRRPTLRDRC